MSEAFIGEIRMFANGYVPAEDWLACDGQIYQIRQYQALYAVIGNLYGGTTPNDFAVPNLGGGATQSSFAVCGVGAAPGTSLNWPMGTTSGDSYASLSYEQMPLHTHQMVRAGGSWTVNKKTNMPSATTQVGGLFDGSFSIPCLTLSPPNTYFAEQAIGTFGGSMPHENRQPYQAVLFAICCYGTYPTPAD